MKNSDFEGTITYIDNAQKSINEQLEHAIHNMTDEQLREFMKVFLEEKRNYERACSMDLYESKDLKLATNFAELIHVHSQNVYNRMVEIVTPKQDTPSDLDSMFLK